LTFDYFGSLAAAFEATIEGLSFAFGKDGGINRRSGSDAGEDDEGGEGCEGEFHSERWMVIMRLLLVSILGKLGSVLGVGE